jgi:hypothetical protein
MSIIHQSRRKLLQTGVAGFCAALFSTLPKISFAQYRSGIDKGIVVASG